MANVVIGDVVSPMIRRPRYEIQRVPGHAGVAIRDPRTGRDLVLDLSELSAEEVERQREEGLAAMRAEGLLRDCSAEPARPTPPPSSSPTIATPPPAVVSGDPEVAIRALLESAPAPLPLLRDTSPRRFAALLLGGQLRISDLEPAFFAAAAKLDRRFEALSGESTQAELEELHRFVAGFVVRAPAMRRAHPEVLRVTERGTRVLSYFHRIYEAKHGSKYAESADDAGHCEAIGQWIDEQVRPADDPELQRKRIVSAVFRQWLADPFAGRCGFALKQFARLLREEPNRFRREPQVLGAAAMAAEVSAIPNAKTITPEEDAKLKDQLRAIGNMP